MTISFAMSVYDTRNLYNAVDREGEKGRENEDLQRVHSEKLRVKVNGVSRVRDQSSG